MGDPNSWLVYNGKNQLKVDDSEKTLKSMIWRYEYPHFRKPSNIKYE
jgi:hypothetical protein